MNERLEPAVGASRLAWGLIIGCWIVQAVGSLQFVVPDGISYIEIAQSIHRGNFGSLLNGYWSPLYPALIAGWLAVLKPSMHYEILAVNCLNVVLLVMALWSFEYFVAGMVVFQRKSAGEGPESLPFESPPVRSLLYVVFFSLTMWFTPANLATPDVIVFALFLLASGIVVRLYCSGQGMLRVFALGVVLGCAYLAKAAMFPIAFVFLAVVALTGKGWARILLTGVVCFLSFLIVAGPFISALSLKKGRLTYGDAGAVNYAEFVNGVTIAIHWQGGPPGSGMPEHPTRKVSELPPVYEFNGPVGGSYPPWSDPSYWYEGVRPRFHLREQLRTLKSSADVYFGIWAGEMAGVTACFIVLLFWSRLPGIFAREFWRIKFLWLPAIAGLGLYALVHVEKRFIAGFVLVLWIAALGALRFPKSTENARAYAATSLAIALLLIGQIAWPFSHSMRAMAPRLDFPALEMADYLHKSGIASGGKVAEVGDPLFDHIWAHLAGVTIVAEVPQEGVLDFWSAAPEVRRHVLDLLAQAGAKVVVAKVVPQGKEAEGWRQVGNTYYYALDLRR
jgi:hypothetical protein